jgi:hypothetical protein
MASNDPIDEIVEEINQITLFSEFPDCKQSEIMYSDKDLNHFWNSENVESIRIKTSDGYEMTMTKDYLGDKWTMLSDIEGVHEKDLDLIKIPCTFAQYYKFINLNSVMNQNIHNVMTPILYNQVEIPARFFSPVDAYWEMFSLKSREFSYEECIVWGKYARSKPKPFWLDNLDMHTYHSNFNLTYDPVYKETDPNLRNSYLEIEWLNLITFLLWEAWVKSSYSNHIEMQHIDWTFRSKIEDFGDNWRTLNADSNLEELTEPVVGLHSETYLLAGYVGLRNHVHTFGRFGYLTEDEKYFLWEKLLNYDTKTFNTMNIAQYVDIYDIRYACNNLESYYYERFANHRGRCPNTRFSDFLICYSFEQNKHLLRSNTYPSHSLKEIVYDIVRNSRLHAELLLKISANMSTSNYGNKSHKFYQLMYHALS